MAEFRTPGVMQEVSTPSSDAQFVMATAVGVKDELLTESNLIKFVNASQAVVSVKDHGALGDGVTDDTASIEAAAAALRAIGGGTLFFPYGTYVVVAMDLVNMNNCLIDLGGSTLTTTDANTSWLVRLRTSNNCKVINGVLEGNRAGRVLNTPLVGNPHNLFVRGGSNIVIENVESNNAVGDGFYVLGEVAGDNTTHPNIDLISCHAATNYRQGLSFIEWTTANVVGGSYNGQTGGDPQSGIDIEPNFGSALVDDAIVSVSGAEFKNNVNQGILSSGTPASGSITLVVSGCVFSGNSNNAIETVHNLVVSGCLFESCNGSDVAAIMQNTGSATVTKTVVSGCQFVDSTQYAVRTTTNKTTVISDCIVQNAKGLVAADNGNLVVSGCIVEGPTTSALTLSQTIGNTSVTGCVFDSTQNYVLFVNTPGYVNVTGCTFTGDNSQVIRCVRGNVNAQSNLFGSSGLALYMDEAGDTSILANNRMEGMDNPYFSAVTGGVVDFSNVVDGVAPPVGGSDESWFEAAASSTQVLSFATYRRISVSVTGAAGSTLTLSVTNPGSSAATDLGDYDLMLKNDSTTGEKTVDFSALGLDTVPTFTQLQGDVSLVKLFWTGSKWLLR